MPKLTLALSVFNVADYIHASMNSILDQSLRDFELLCIDDASTDETWDILREYAQRDSRIRLFRQEYNQGLSVSRNKAIANAQGDYIIMLDGDDLYAQDMAEKAYNEALKSGADMVLWDYAIFSENKEISKACAKPSALLQLDVKDKIQLLRRPAFSPSRLIKTSVLRDLKIHFPEGMTKQDIPVHWKLVTSLNNISIVPMKLLFYRQQPNSTSNQKGRSVFSLAYVMDIVGRQLYEDGIYDIYKDEFLRSRLSLLQGMYDFVSPELKSEALIKVRERLGKDEMDYINDPDNRLTSQVRNFYGMLKGSFWSRIKYKGYHRIRSVYRLFKEL